MTKVFNEVTWFKQEMIEGSVAARGRFARHVPNASVVKIRSSELGGRGRGHEDPGAASMVFVLTAAGGTLVEGSRSDEMTAGSGSEEGER